jgi:hypothetical protein
MRHMTRAFYAGVREHHPWLPITDIRALLEESRTLIDRHPEGETPVIVGSPFLPPERRGANRRGPALPGRRDVGDSAPPLGASTEGWRLRRSTR